MKSKGKRTFYEMVLFIGKRLCIILSWIMMNEMRMEMTHRGFFFNFQNTSASEYIFLLTNFSLLYRNTHGAWQRKMYSLALKYILRAVNVGAELKCLLECELMRGPLQWDLFYIPLMWINVRCKLCNIKVQTIQKITCNFREKIQHFAKNKYTGGQIL